MSVVDDVVVGRYSLDGQRVVRNLFVKLFFVRAFWVVASLVSVGLFVLLFFAIFLSDNPAMNEREALLLIGGIAFMCVPLCAGLGVFSGFKNRAFDALQDEVLALKGWLDEHNVIAVKRNDLEYNYDLLLRFNGSLSKARRYRSGKSVVYRGVEYLFVVNPDVDGEALLLRVDKGTVYKRSSDMKRVRLYLLVVPLFFCIGFLGMVCIYGGKISTENIGFALPVLGMVNGFGFAMVVREFLLDRCVNNFSKWFVSRGFEISDDYVANLVRGLYNDKFSRFSNIVSDDDVTNWENLSRVVSKNGEYKFFEFQRGWVMVPVPVNGFGDDDADTSNATKGVNGVVGAAAGVNAGGVVSAGVDGLVKSDAVLTRFGVDVEGEKVVTIGSSSDVLSGLDMGTLLRDDTGLFSGIVAGLGEDALGRVMRVVKKIVLLRGYDDAVEADVVERDLLDAIALAVRLRMLAPDDDLVVFGQVVDRLDAELGLAVDERVKLLKESLVEQNEYIGSRGDKGLVLSTRKDDKDEN